jgi:hypothetical protein
MGKRSAGRGQNSRSHRQANRLHCTTRVMRQPLLRWQQMLPPGHGSEPFALFALCKHARCARRLRTVPRRGRHAWLLFAIPQAANIIFEQREYAVSELLKTSIRLLEAYVSCQSSSLSLLTTTVEAKYHPCWRLVRLDCARQRRTARAPGLRYQLARPGNPMTYY